MLLAVSDIVWQALIAAGVTVVLAWIGRRAQIAATSAETKTEEVKTTLKATNAEVGDKLDGIAKVGEATHVLVNNNMAIQLRLNAVLARRLADAPGATPADRAAADAADRLLAEHLAKQDRVDATALTNARPLGPPVKGGGS
jgi:hypothetical protein